MEQKTQQILTKSEKINLGTKEISKRIRQQLKENFPKVTFSVTMESYSMGSSITVCLMETDFKVIKDFSQIPKQAVFDYKKNGYTEEQLKQNQDSRYHQLNKYTLREEYNPLNWCNGVFLTETGHNLLKEVVKIADHYNYDDSDPQSDYYSVNFSFHLNIGKWDKPFIQEEKEPTEDFKQMEQLENSFNDEIQKQEEKLTEEEYKKDVVFSCGYETGKADKKREFKITDDNLKKYKPDWVKGYETGYNEQTEQEQRIKAYEERQQAKLERYQELNHKAEAESKNSYERSHRISEAIPFGQPILVGHHSEGRHRRDIERIHNLMDKSIQEQEKAEYYNKKVENIINPKAISSDDPEAISKLQEKIKMLEEKRQKIKQMKKEGKEFPHYTLPYLSQDIRTAKKRIEHLQKIRSIEEVKEEKNGIRLEVCKEDNRVRLYFPDIPSEETRNYLKHNGFRWSPYNKAWQRQISDWALHLAREVLNKKEE